jgi:hypothetical protein
LRLACNEPGKVCFELHRRPAGGQERQPFSGAAAMRPRYRRPDQPVDDHVSLAFQVNRLRRMKLEAMLQALVGSLIDLDDAGNAFAGDPTGDVHGVAPEVVDELLLADDTGDHRPGTDADAQFEAHLVELKSSCSRRHISSAMSASARSDVAALVVEAGGHHVGVADGLDLLQAILLGQFVEAREDLVEHGENLLRRQAFGDPGEVHDVGEHHRDFGKAVGDRLGAVLQAFGDRRRQDVEQQSLRTLLLDLQQAVRFLQALLRAVLFAVRVAQQQVNDARYGRKVEGEEEGRGLRPAPSGGRLAESAR